MTRGAAGRALSGQYDRKATVSQAALRLSCHNAYANIKGAPTYRDRRHAYPAVLRYVALPALQTRANASYSVLLDAGNPLVAIW